MINKTVNTIDQNGIQPAPCRITSREREVLHLIAYEHSSKEIASRLYVSYETVNSHRKNIMTKLQVRNTAGMIRAAFEREILPITSLSLNT